MWWWCGQMGVTELQRRNKFKVTLLQSLRQKLQPCLLHFNRQSSLPFKPAGGALSAHICVRPLEGERIMTPQGKLPCILDL